MTHDTLNPGDAAAVDAELELHAAGSNADAACSPVRKLAASLRAADPASGASLPPGLLDRTSARIAAEAAGSAPAADPALLLRQAEMLDAWLAEGGGTPAPAEMRPLQALLEAGLGASALGELPGDLVSRAADRLEAERRAAALAAQLDRFRGPAGGEDNPPIAGRIGGGLRGGFRQALAAAAVLLIGTALLLPALRQSATEAGRLACLGNLRAAGGAFARYAADFDGVLPRMAGFGSLAPGGLLPALGLGPADGHQAVSPAVAELGAGNARNLGLLVGDGADYLPEDRLMCHGQPAEAVEPSSSSRIGWRIPGSAAYSYQSQAGPEPLRVDAARSDLGVLADRNPLFMLRDGRLQLRDGVPVTMPSMLHRGEGQNVLTVAGDARWTVRPQLGFSRVSGAVKADHLWAAEGAAPGDACLPMDIEQDAVLLP